MHLHVRQVEKEQGKVARRPRAVKEARRPQLLQQQRLKHKKKKNPRPSRPCRKGSNYGNRRGGSSSRPWRRPWLQSAGTRPVWRRSPWRRCWAATTPPLQPPPSCFTRAAEREGGCSVFCEEPFHSPT
ncbi:unnamed protein product, partial [Ectocarpus sp. 12 AP-2014]